MKERPILFSAPMVRAILAGQKTVTRRVVKLPRWAVAGSESVEGGVMEVDTANGCTADIVCPYGAPGDRLWVRETWACLDAKARPGCRLAYRADTIDGERVRVDAPWKPSIHLPRWASRITLEVVKVSVERLHEITDEDAIREGIRPWSKDGNLNKYAPADGEGDGPCWPWVDCPKSAPAAYSKLWEEINGHGSWAKNPWGWRVEFKVVKAVGQ